MAARLYVGILIGASGVSVTKVCDVVQHKLELLAEPVNLLPFPTKACPSLNWFRESFPACLTFGGDYSSQRELDNVSPSSKFFASLDALVVFWDGRERIAENMAQKAFDLGMPMRVYHFDPLITLTLGDKFRSKK